MKKLTVVLLILLSMLPAAKIDGYDYTIVRNGQVCSTHPATTWIASTFLVAFVYSCANGNLNRKTN